MFLRIANVLVGLAIAVSSAMAADQPPIKQQAMTTHYRLDLQIGPTVKIVMPADLKTGAVKDGEVIIRGSMTTPKDTANTRQLDLHVVALDKGTAVPDATVKIVITVSGHKTTVLPTAVLYGVAEGASDTHYGNRVGMPPGNYTIDVTANGENVSFMVSIPSY